MACVKNSVRSLSSGPHVWHTYRHRWDACCVTCIMRAELPNDSSIVWNEANERVEEGQVQSMHQRQTEHGVRQIPHMAQRFHHANLWMGSEFGLCMHVLT